MEHPLSKLPSGYDFSPLVQAVSICSRGLFISCLQKFHAHVFFIIFFFPTLCPALIYGVLCSGGRHQKGEKAGEETSSPAVPTLWVHLWHPPALLLPKTHPCSPVCRGTHKTLLCFGQFAPKVGEGLKGKPLALSWLWKPSCFPSSWLYWV